MKIRSKIIVLLSSTFAGLILIFSAIIYVLSSNYVFNDFYDRLETRTTTTIHIELDHRGDKQYIKDFKEEYLEKLPEEKSVVVELDANNQPVLKTKEITANHSFIQEVVKHNIAKRRVDNVLVFGKLFTSESGKSFVVYTSARNMEYTKYSHYLRGLLISMFTASIVLIFVISLWLSKRLIKPISRLSKSIHEIGTENLHIRLENKQESDELGLLIQTMNTMLDRLETSFETQNNFISNASHELNTPLTAIIGQADLTLSKERDVEDYKQALNNILEQADKLNKKTKALLFLAQTGFDGKRIPFDTIRVDELIFETLDTMKRISPGNKAKFDVESLPEQTSRLEVLGNAQLLQLALSNVILNAVKYSENKDVNVYLSTNVKEISIHVQDKGIGIPQEELRYIYDPFFRASNTTAYEGYGIGLPLTRNIIRLHSGRIIVHSEAEQGTLVSLILPIRK